MSSQGRGHTIFFALFALSFVLTTIEGYPAKENAVQNTEPLALPLSAQSKPDTQSEQSEKPRNCYHFYLTRNMSSLLSDATKMLRQVHEKREREWILTFIYRIKSLAEHLRSHPESQNYEECLTVEDEEDKKKKTSILNESLRITQPELYFVDDMSPAQSQKRSSEEPEASKESEEGAQKQEQQGNQDSEPSVADDLPQKEAEHFNSVAESTSESLSLMKDTESHPPSDSPPTAAGTSNTELTSDKESKQEPEAAPAPEEYRPMIPDDQIGKGQDDSAIIHSAPEPGCEPDVTCSEVNKRDEEDRQRQAEMLHQLHAMQEHEEEERQHQMILKERIRLALLEDMAPEVKKLRTVGGTKSDLIYLWNRSGEEIARDEARKQRENDFDYEEDGAAAGDLSSNDKYPPNYRTVAPSDDQVYKKDDQPYVHNDVLVQQLYDARDEEPQYRPTRSLSDPKDREYLIFSTHIPY